MDELRRIRKERGLSQQRLAELANVDKVTIIHIEGGKVSPKVETLEKLAGALAVEMADLFPKAQDTLPLSAAEGHLTVSRTWEDIEQNLTTEQVREILQGVQDGRITVEAAVHQLEKAGRTIE